MGLLLDGLHALVVVLVGGGWHGSKLADLATLERQPRLASRCAGRKRGKATGTRHGFCEGKGDRTRPCGTCCYMRLWFSSQREWLSSNHTRTSNSSLSGLARAIWAQAVRRRHFMQCSLCHKEQSLARTSQQLRSGSARYFACSQLFLQLSLMLANSSQLLLECLLCVFQRCIFRLNASVRATDTNSRCRKCLTSSSPRSVVAPGGREWTRL